MNLPAAAAKKASPFNANQRETAMTIKSKTLLIAAAVASIATGTAAAAQGRDVTILAPTLPSDVLVQVVRYGDLNLSSPAGQARLEDRVRSAVDNVCPAGFAIDLNAASQSSACKIAAYGDARSQMDQAIARARSGQLASAGGALRIAARR
ncbi:MAG: UrcA family protein [Alphaproteobacteria bacterium]|nr:MAG: UrcA family protein [Alphaproteobacteria bacterium]